LCKSIHYATLRITIPVSLIHYLGKLFVMLDYSVNSIRVGDVAVICIVVHKEVAVC